MSDWRDVTETTGIPGKPTTLRKDRDNGYFAEVWQVAHVVGWSVWGPQYQTALASGESDSMEHAMADAEHVLSSLPFLDE